MSGTPRVRSGAFPQTPTTIRAPAASSNTHHAAAPPTPSPSPPVVDASGSKPFAFSSGRTSLGSDAASTAQRLRSAPPPPTNVPGRARLSTRSLPRPARREFGSSGISAGHGGPGPGYGPLIPTNILDAPTQRFYVVAIYAGLLAWRCYDWVQLLEDNTTSAWQFLKWVALDFAFWFGLPELRIPWLELARPAVIVLYCLHVLLDYLLMFNVGLPILAAFATFFRFFYDRELSISEHYVKTSSILHNQSLISGRQIINILPEGSAVLNPDALPFCIGSGPSAGAGPGAGPLSASLPLYFNATLPAEVELIRTDLDTNAEETVRLSKAQLREIGKLVKRHDGGASAGAGADGAPGPVRYDVVVKKTGAYRLGRVLDEYKLEVQRPSPYSFVVACPSARVGEATSKNKGGWLSAASLASSASSASDDASRCHGDLSDLVLEVDGTAPLKIVYSRTINGKDHSFHFQSLQPEGFVSPLAGTQPGTQPGRVFDDEPIDADTDADAKFDATQPAAAGTDVTWARSQRVAVGLNETMHVGGAWRYSIDEVHDAFGNVAKYGGEAADEHDVRPRAARKHLAQTFFVRERPQIRLKGCDLRQPLKVARGQATRLPVQYRRGGTPRPDDGTAHTVTWQFSPVDTLTRSGDHGDAAVLETFHAKTADDVPTISAPGLYTLRSVAADGCEGDVQEPASCLLLNPLEPKVAVRSEGIPDSCGGHSVGLRVDLDLVGTPPFVLRYDVSSNGQVRHEKLQIPGMRYQFELVPRTAGQHRYLFRSIDDAVYKAQPLSGPDMVLEQNVKPAARAALDHATGRVSACLGEAVGVDVVLSGEAPFTLEYMLLHESKRRPYKADNIEGHRYRIETPALGQGGEYTLSLTSVVDRSGCRTVLKNQQPGDEVKISVRRQRPRGGFGLVENRRRVAVVEDADVRLPLRLTGEGPWTVGFRRVDDGEDERLETRTLTSGNDHLTVRARGTYELVDVADRQCRGEVDVAASRFEVDWFARPTLSMVPSESVAEQAGQPGQPGRLYTKADVCEGDVDGFEVDLRGAAPFHVAYDVRHVPAAGPRLKQQTSLAHRQLDAALGRASIQLDTARAGTYRYEFAAPADSLYAQVPRTRDALVLQQTVHAKPSAVFAKPGVATKLCMAAHDGDEAIPMVLTGVPPFHVEFEIRHASGASAAETYRVPSIMTHAYGLQIPRAHLRPGTQVVRIRKVRDARGCQHKTDEAAGTSGGASGATQVQVQLFEAPEIYALESRTDYCVGERISYTLSGTPPFDVWYTFNGVVRKGASATTTFKRVAEAPGDFVVVGLQDRASACRADVHLARTIHPLPSVRVSQGRTARVDIHEGGAVEMVFEFGGTPPFEFTYTRSSNARKGQRSQVLETRHDVSYEHRKVIRASQEGTYEVVAIKDKYCGFSAQRGAEAATL